MPKKKYNLPKGLTNKPAGSENWYQVFYKKNRQPTIKWVRLEAHDLAGAKIERERLLRTYELGLFDPWEKKKAIQAQKDPTLGEAVDQYMEAVSGLASNTIKNKRCALGLFTGRVSRGRQRRIRSITEGDVERFITANQWKATTRRDRLMILSGFFTWCCDEGLTEGNPVASLPSID